jgi:hypothetical protein
VPDPLRPTRRSSTYAVRAPLVRWLEQEAGRASTELGRRYRVLDVGSGMKPYLPIFGGYVENFAG